MVSAEFAIVELAIIVLAPFVVGVLFGIDRKLTARMQNRVGPPIAQPLYDLRKLIAKQPRLMNGGQVGFALAYLVLQVTALAILVTGGDLLVVFFVSGAGSLCLVIGAFSARSPFSHMGAQRELLQVLAYEPVLFLVIISIGYQERSFLASDIVSPLLVALPLSLAALFVVLIVKLQKSPYDISSAHTEIISGPHIEYSGPFLAVVEFAHWAEVAVIFGIFTLFVYDTNPWLSVVAKAMIVLVALFVAVLVDNAAARLTPARMVRFVWFAGVLLVAINLIALFVASEVIH